jgi:phosphoglycerate dehydrogenase-like enzyme
MAEHEPGTILLYSGGIHLQDSHIGAIHDAAPDVEFVDIASLEEWRARRGELAPNLEAAVGFPYDHITDLVSCPRFRWHQQTGAGADWLLRHPEVAQSDVLLTNASGVTAIPIAEHIIALMFALARRLSRFAQAQREHQWYARGRLSELDGGTVGIIGLGAIGEITAEKVRGLNMRVIGMRRDPTKGSAHVDRMLGPDGLYELLEQSDWVVLTTALTPETRGLLGEPELRAMKDSAYLINIARGEVVDEEVLAQALEEGWIAGAGLDVFEREPLSPDSPLWDMRNVVITSHWAGYTPHYGERVTEIIIENIRRYRQGEPLKNVIDKALTY